jgi:hypothetical protein
MRFKDYKLVFMAVSLFGGLLCASPTICAFLSLPSDEKVCI